MDVFDKYVGQVFDERYKINKVIGMGGMAVVFEAVDMVTSGRVAIKMLKDDINNDTQAIKRFINESKAVSMLSHPNIVPIYAFSVTDNLKYLVMELIEGINLKKYIIKKGVLSLRETINYTEQILKALELAHSKGIIHRDIKPQNIMLLNNGLIKVTDFGIAKLPNAEQLTVADKAIGTVFYVSPEQASNKAIDSRSDLYSLGVVMYEMATGKLPFTADSSVSVALMQVRDLPRHPCEINPTIPKGLEQIILGAMEKDPEKRFQNTSQMLRYLSQLKANPSYVFKTKPSSQSQYKKSMESQSVSSSPTNKNDRNNKPHKKSRSMLPIISAVTAAFLIVIGLSATYVFTTIFQSDEADKSRTIDIPKFIGSLYDTNMKSELENNNYRVYVKYDNNPEYEENIIIDQSPAEGEKRKVIDGQQFCDLTLTVSKGTQTITLPDLTILDYREVGIELKGLGLVAIEIHEYHDTIGEGYVIKTEPMAGGTVNAGDEVTLYVSKGQKIETVLVPDFINKTEEEAKRLLVENKLALGDISYKESSKPKGTILEQSKSPFSSVPEKATKIDFVISLGK